MVVISLYQDTFIDVLKHLNPQHLGQKRLVSRDWNKTIDDKRNHFARPRLGSLNLYIDNPLFGLPNYNRLFNKPREYTYEVSPNCEDYCCRIWENHPNLIKRLKDKTILGRRKGFWHANIVMCIHKKNFRDPTIKKDDDLFGDSILLLKSKNILNEENIPIALHFFSHCRGIFYDYVRFTNILADLWKLSMSNEADFIACNKLDFTDFSTWPYYNAMTVKEIRSAFEFLRLHIRSREISWDTLMLSNLEGIRASELPPEKQCHLVLQTQLIDFLLNGAHSCREQFQIRCRNFIYKEIEFFERLVQEFLQMRDTSNVIPSIHLSKTEFKVKPIISELFETHYIGAVTVEIIDDDVIEKYIYRFINQNAGSWLEFHFLKCDVDIYLMYLL